jgi:alpha-2-macroglobulin
VRHSDTARCLALATALVMVATSCGPRASRPIAPKGVGGDLVLQQTGDAPPGLDLRLSNGRQGPPATDRARLAPARKLGDGEVRALLARLRPLAERPDDRSPFARRARSQPPPRTGKTIQGSFPAPPLGAAPPATADRGAKLEVLRWAPEGEVPIAPQLQLTFSQPMVAVTSHADTVAAGVPATLTPQPPGAWRWVGSKTLLFDPQVRFPMATTYQVEVPAGTRSATGNLLAEPHRFTFETPPPTVRTAWPSHGPTRLDVPMFVLFDQRIDPAAVLGKVEVSAGKRRYRVRALTDAEVAEDATIRTLVTQARADAHDGRWIAFRSTEELPRDSAVTVTIPAGTPSAEGPNPTRKAQSFSFQTFPPLRITESYCGWRGSPCPPGTPFHVQFNNPLDPEAWDDALVTVEPAIPGLKIAQHAGYLTVAGRTRARTRYTVHLSGGIVDGFGQTLGKDVALTFRTGDAQPSFYGPSGMIVVDPAARTPTYDVFTTNYDSLKVKLYAVEPADFQQFARYQREYWDVKRRGNLPGKKVFDQLIRIDGGKDELAETRVDLTPALGAARRGHVIAVVEPYPWRERYDPPVLRTWIQVSRIAVDAFVDGDELQAWATRLADGAPVTGARLELQPHAATTSSDARGVARFALPSGGKGTGMLIARHGDDVAFVVDEQAWWDDGTSWHKRPRTDSLRWYVTDDRQMYRPGEEVHLKGWLRRVGEYEGGDVAGIAGMVNQVGYRVVGPMGNQLAAGTSRLSAAGGFDLKIKLPDTPNLGQAVVHLEATGRLRGSHYHGFQIQEFRRPEYEVTTEVSQGPHVIGGAADVTATASYFAGGGLAGAPVQWYVTASETTYTPPGRDDYVFGTWRPWWGGRAWWDEAATPAKSWSHAATSDALGQHVLHLDFLSVNPATPMSVVTHATVTDVNRQAWSSAATLLVHPALAYVGLKAKKPFVEKGQPIELEGVVVDLDGKPLLGRRYEVRAVRLDWKMVKGSYVTEEVDEQTCAGTGAADPFRCEIVPREGGTYKITAITADDDGRRNQTELTVWVAGGELPPARDVQQEQVQLVPDGRVYQDGDTAQILVQSPFHPAQGLLTLRRSGIVVTERFEMTGPTTVLRVPIKDAYVPNVHVQVDLVGKAARLGDDGKPRAGLPDRPAYAMGRLDLPVPPRRRTLAVDVAPRAARVDPGSEAIFDVTVRDAAGKPVAGAEVALIVVDEAILSLTGHRFASPIDVFYSPRDPGARDYYYRARVKLSRPDAALFGDELATGMLGDVDHDGVADMADAEAAPGAVVTRSQAVGGAPPPPPAPRREGAKKEADFRAKAPAAEPAPAQPQPQPAIAVRTNFNPLAAFAPEVKTGGDGRAALTVTMPDNLTRYRVVAIAVAGERDFGKGESAVTARLPLMVRPSPPRFLNFGDVFELPVVLQNQTDAPMTVRVAVRASNARITDGAGRQVVVPARDRVEVRFPAAAELAGTARFQLAAAAGPYHDAAELALPVWTPATTEAFATYGVIERGAIRQPVALPGKVVERFGGLEVETSSTQLQALTDAFVYLVTYPYECSEQIASRILGIASLRDVLTAFRAEGLPPPAEIEARLGRDLDRLESMQNHDGGFPVWRRGFESWPFLSVHVTNALIRAQHKGYPVPAAMLQRAHGYLKNIERRYPSYYSAEVRRTITAYALYVRKLLGDKDVARARGLLKEAGGADKLSLEAAGWLLGVLAGDGSAAAERAAILRHLANRASETAAAANWSTGYADGAHLILHSDRRVDAIILESLIQEQRGSGLIPKVVTGLLAHRKAGRWANTQDNVFVLMALDRYFQEYEKVAPDFVARVWLGDQYAGEHAFKGHRTDRHQIEIPMKDVAALGKGDLVIHKDGGKGRLYYRIGMTYAPADLQLPPADHGFVVERRYEPVDDPDDVVRHQDGSWRIKAGARVRVRLSMVADNRRYHVALVDPLPAGLEPMNPALAVTGPVPQDARGQQQQGRYWWWHRTWYEHQNLRDERVEAFTTLLWAGVWEYTYVARATTPGTFVVPPSKAEEMYAPETFGRSASDRVIVR